MMTKEDIAECVDEIVDDIDPDRIEDLINRSGLLVSAWMEMVTNELKARLVIE